MQKIIHLISGPRNLSTALMYSFGNRTDFDIVDEPLYAYYLSNTEIDHPGKAEILASQSQDYQRVLDQVFFGSFASSHLFIKNMAHHLIMKDWSFLKTKMKNLLLIRDPKQLIASFSQQISQPTMRDIGIKKEWEIFDYLDQNGVPPVVLDSGALLKNPRKTLMAVCDRLEITFDESMLHWEAGPRQEDGVWAKYWYDGVHQSTHFAKRKTSDRPLADYLVPLYQEAMPYYNLLFEKSIKL